MPFFRNSMCELATKPHFYISTEAPLTSNITSILMNNCSDSLKRQARKHRQEPNALKKSLKRKYGASVYMYKWRQVLTYLRIPPSRCSMRVNSFSHSMLLILK